MAKFKKKIVTAAVHTVGRLDGREEKDAITPERIKTWVKNTKEAQKYGVLIPGPLAHQDKNKKFATPIVKLDEGETLADAYSGENELIPPAWDIASLNAGFWDNLDVDPLDGALVGEVDVPGDENDSNSLAGKVGKTVKQTSILVMPGRKIKGKDGKEHEIGEHIAHVALCLHPQENGQPNFEPLSPVPDGLAMSFVLAMDDLTGLPDPTKPKDEELYTVITLLRSALNVALPEDVSRENFLASLKLVLTQKLADQKETEQTQSIQQRPQDAVTKQSPIAMSQTTQSTTPNTTEAILMSMLVKNRKKELNERVNKLLSTGRISREYADKTLFPRINGLTMSAADVSSTGELNRSSLDDLLEGLETATPLVGESLIDQGLSQARPDGTYTEEIPQDVITGMGVADLAPETADTILDQISW